MSEQTFPQRLRTVFSIDLRSLALFRIMLALVLLLDLALRSVDLATFYTDSGLLPRRDMFAISSHWYWSLHAASGDLWWQALLFIVAALFALALLVGYRTKLASVASFVLLASLMNRNPLLLQGGDQLLVVLAFWAIFLPLGARRSVDAALERHHATEPNRQRAALLDPQPYFSVATVAIILQVLYLYTFTAILKTGDAWTSRFDAAFYAVSLQHFATPVGAWMSNFPGFLKLATVFVLCVEFAAPVLVLLPFLWPRLRLLGIALLASLHVAFGLMLHIGLFPLIDLTALSLLLPGAAWAWTLGHSRRYAGRTIAHAARPVAPSLATATAGAGSAVAANVAAAAGPAGPTEASIVTRSATADRSEVPLVGGADAGVGAGAGSTGAVTAPESGSLIGTSPLPRTPREAIVIHYDRGCDFCLKTCLILRELLLPPRVRIVEAQEDPAIHAIMEREDSWVVTDAAGRAYTHWHAMAFLFSQSVLLRPLGWLMSLPPLLALGNAIYRRVAAHRGAMGRFSARFLPWRSLRLRPTIAGALVAAFFLYIITAFNVYGLPGVRAPMPDFVDRTARLTRIDQRWDMFAPYPLTVSSYPLVPGTLRNGETVDLYELTSSATDWEEPGSFYPLYPSYRWRKYLGRVDEHRDNTVRRAFGDWLCRTWNVPGRPRDTQLATLEVHFVKLATNTEGKPKASSRRMVWRHWCYAEFAPK